MTKPNNYLRAHPAFSRAVKRLAAVASKRENRRVTIREVTGLLAGVIPATWEGLRDANRPTPAPAAVGAPTTPHEESTND